MEIARPAVPGKNFVSVKFYEPLRVRQKQGINQKADAEVHFFAIVVSSGNDFFDIFLRGSKMCFFLIFPAKTGRFGPFWGPKSSNYPMELI